MFVTRRLFHHKYAAPQGPKLQSLKDAITSKLNPICFYVKNDPNYSTYGILCSPLFEGKTYSEMNEIVNGILEPLNLKGRVRLNCQPPSRYNVCINNPFYPTHLKNYIETQETYSSTVESRPLTERLALIM